MGKRLNWESHKNRKRPSPLITFAEKDDNKRKALQIAKRIKQGHKSPQAHLHGCVWRWSAEEVAEWAATHGYKTASETDDEPRSCNRSSH